MAGSDSNADEFDLDLEALSRRYAEEREKRLRPDTTGQFQALEGRFARFAQDPHADPLFARDPIVDEADVVVIGGGFGGLLAGARLRERAVQSLRIVEKGADFGGTWYWNRYPGVRCDVESYVYFPLLEETGYVPSEKYATGAEIYEHCRRIARTYGLYEGALFQTDVIGAAWDAGKSRWIVSTSRGDAIAARHLVSAKGLYSTPKLPGIPGVESFAGESFHTSRWDYGYTGGDAAGGLVNLRDKVVGVIGTGSTGIQCVPPLAEWARQLYVFQRTPSSIDERNNRPTDPAWARALEPGWHRARNWNFTLVTAGIPQPEDLVDDAWTEIVRGAASPTRAAAAAQPMDPGEFQSAQMWKMEKVRRRIDAVVQDRAVAEALKPYYHYFCKRPGFSDDYLQTFNRENVALVDTAGQGVERITPNGVVVAGREYALGCLVYATGFEFMGDYAREAGFDLVGPGGQTLSRHWAQGVRSLFGVQTAGFPNFFTVSLIQAGVSVNYTHIADEQARHIAYVISRCLEDGIAAVEPAAEAVDAWVGAILEKTPERRAFLDACTPGYINQEGRRDSAFEHNAPHPGGPAAYIERLENWRRDGRMEGLRVQSGD
jgi:cyclohexanone monooxygenase